jgi:hypothetical protein
MREVLCFIVECFGKTVVTKQARRQKAAEKSQDDCLRCVGPLGRLACARESCTAEQGGHSGRGKPEHGAKGMSQPEGRAECGPPGTNGEIRLEVRHAEEQ